MTTTRCPVCFRRYRDKPVGAFCPHCHGSALIPFKSHSWIFVLMGVVFFAVSAVYPLVQRIRFVDWFFNNGVVRPENLSIARTLWAVTAAVVGIFLLRHVSHCAFARICTVSSRSCNALRRRASDPVGELVARVNASDPSTRDEALGSLLLLGNAGWDAAIHQIEGSARIGATSLRSLAHHAGDQEAKCFLFHLMITSGSMTRRLDAALALDGMGWAPADHDQELLYFLAKREYTRLFQAGEQGKRLLLLAMKHEVTRELVCVFLHGLGELEWGVRALCHELTSLVCVLDRDAFQTLVEIGMDVAIPSLKRAQDTCGDKESATLLLNCNCRPLEDAAKSWAHRHGYKIVTYPGQTKKWGSLGLKHYH